MTPATIALVVGIVVAVMGIIMALLVRSARPKGGRDRDSLGLDRYLTVRYDQNIALDDNGFLFSADSASPEIRAFERLGRLAVITTDQGPLVDDVFLALDFDQGPGWLLASGHPGYNQVYEALAERLPLDYHQYINAMASTDNAVFVIWSRGSAPPPAG